jgi:hypothetical protein
MRPRASRPHHPESPFRINLEQQHKRAKELLAGLRAGDEDALLRFSKHYRDAACQGYIESFRAVRLSDAQFVIARELGLPSWPRLKAHIAAMQRERGSIESSISAPDRKAKTLHIRCGSDLKVPLKSAGFGGDFLEYSDPLCQGPVLASEGWLDCRAGFLASAYGGPAGQSREQIAESLAAAEEALGSAAARYERIVLWFEHDSHDQLILIRCLAQFSRTPPIRLELISIDRFPGGARFIGLGQLPPEALRLIWHGRALVSEQQLQIGSAVWDMLRSPDPAALAKAALVEFPGLPQLAKAIRRHCQEFPWVEDGLSLTERLILQLIAERPRTAGEIFRDLTQEHEPLPWLGDLMMLSIVENMKRASQPVFAWAFVDEMRSWQRERLTITPLGREVLAGKVDWLSLSPPVRWLGGTCIDAKQSCWRWNEASEALIRQ